MALRNRPLNPGCQWEDVDKEPSVWPHLGRGQAAASGTTLHQWDGRACRLLLLRLPAPLPFPITRLLHLEPLKPKSFILDGEVAVFDKGLISRFEWLRGRPKDESATLPVYIAFDVLELAGRDLRTRPLKERRRVLERLVSNQA